MDDPRAGWMAHDGRWRTDPLPPGWWQHPDGRWFPPDADEVERTIAAGYSAGPTGPVATYRSWPRWARIAAPVSAAILGLAVLSAVAGEPDKGGQSVAAVSDEPAASTTSRSPSPSWVSTNRSGVATATSRVAA